MNIDKRSCHLSVVAQKLPISKSLFLILVLLSRFSELHAPAVRPLSRALQGLGPKFFARTSGARTYVRPASFKATPKTGGFSTPTGANFMRSQGNISPNTILVNAMRGSKTEIPNKSQPEIQQENMAPNVPEELNNTPSEIQGVKQLLDSNVFIFINLPPEAKYKMVKNVLSKLEAGGNISEVVTQELVETNEITETEIAWLTRKTIGTTETAPSKHAAQMESNSDGHSNLPKGKKMCLSPKKFLAAIAAGTLSVTGAFDLLDHTLGKKEIGDDAKEALEVWKAACSGLKMLLLRSAKKNENQEKSVVEKELKTKKRLAALDDEEKEALSEAHALLNRVYQKERKAMGCRLDWTEFLKNNPKISEAYYKDFFGVAFFREIDEGKSVVDIANHVTKVVTEHINKEEADEKKNVTLAQKMDGQFSKLASGAKSTTRDD
ncbi:hypothetical protein DdX_16973 [Ditylenchus destructor]|uniref:Uncharacterized protein n=1 Tax=Ditylenchus destructor TaxID=166010 RepID=A0AAD4QZE5_9BILA|nr:hypothetical protein DdX_16973 [Ditylenchus destructor]